MQWLWIVATTCLQKWHVARSDPMCCTAVIVVWYHLLVCNGDTGQSLSACVGLCPNSCHRHLVSSVGHQFCQLMWVNTLYNVDSALAVRSMLTCQMSSSVSKSDRDRRAAKHATCKVCCRCKGRYSRARYLSNWQVQHLTSIVIDLNGWLYSPTIRWCPHSHMTAMVQTRTTESSTSRE